MKYKTRREFNRPFALFAFVLGVIYLLGSTAFILDNRNPYSDFSLYMITSIMILLFISIFFAYCFSSNIKRNRYKNRGKRFDGIIVGAEEEFYGRGEHTYYLKIVFYENGEKKTRFTEGYVGNPCEKLNSLKCDIYAFEGKYIEGNFDAKNHRGDSKNLSVPISKYKKSSKKTNNYV